MCLPGREELNVTKSVRRNYSANVSRWYAGSGIALLMMILCLSGCPAPGGASTTVSGVPNEGSVASPVTLTVNQAHTFQMGPSSSNPTSYYSFTTNGAGKYAIDGGGSGSYNATLYSDPGFSTSVSAQTSVQHGCEFADMGATTTYFLKLENTSSNILTFSGQIMDPTAIASDSTDSQGSVGSPVPLTVGVAIPAKVGGHFNNRTSYYSFTTGAGIDYVLSASGSGNSVKLDVYGAADFSSYWYAEENLALNNGSAGLLPLSPNSTYYLEATNPNSGTAPISFNLEGSASSSPQFTALPSNGTWTVGNLGDGDIIWYVATVTGGQNYVLKWDDVFQGSGIYTGYDAVEAYQADRLTPYFVNGYPGYTTPMTISVPSGQTKVYICVDAAWIGSSGTFALQIQPQ